MAGHGLERVAAPQAHELDTLQHLGPVRARIATKPVYFVIALECVAALLARALAEIQGLRGLRLGFLALLRHEVGVGQGYLHALGADLGGAGAHGVQVPRLAPGCPALVLAGYAEGRGYARAPELMAGEGFRH